MTYEKNKLVQGDIRYVSGFASTTVEIVGNVTGQQVQVKYLTVSEYNAHQPNDVVYMSRRILYPRGER